MTCASLSILKSHTVDECNHLIDDPCVVGLECCSFATLKYVSFPQLVPFSGITFLEPFVYSHPCFHAGPILRRAHSTVPGTFRVNGSFNVLVLFLARGKNQTTSSRTCQQNLSSMALIVPLTQLVWRLANIDSLRKGFVLALGV